jgi:outer membrane protein assembly factor BamD
MNFFYRITLILILILFQSCAKEKKISAIKEINQEKEMIATYKEAMENLEAGDGFYAAKKFLESELLFPQSDWAPKSALMAAYSYYYQDYYSEAVFNLKRFMNTYPSDERMVYANYLLAMCYYNTIADEKKDLAPLINAKKEFEKINLKYPNTDFALDSKFKMGLINDILASKEMYIGRHYIKKEKWIAAINRFKNILSNYSTTIYTEEAIHRLVEIHYRIGLVEESKKYASLLGYNYLSSEWYKKSYKIFNRKYDDPIKKINQKGEEGLIKKFKKIFN